MKKMYLFILSAFVFTAFACNEDDMPDPTPLEVEAVSNFEAPGDVYDRTTNPPTLIEENDVQYFDFSAGTEVSVNQDWDIGIKGTTIITNGGINGSGGVEATTIAAIFDVLDAVPAGTTYSSDSADALAINKNPDFEDRWYSYAAGIITPVPGKVVLLKDTEGNHVKMEIQCYYRDCPANPVPGVNNGIYTFRYVYQPDGSENFDFSNQ